LLHDPKWHEKLLIDDVNGALPGSEFKLSHQLDKLGQANKLNSGGSLARRFPRGFSRKRRRCDKNTSIGPSLHRTSEAADELWGDLILVSLALENDSIREQSIHTEGSNSIDAAVP